MILLHGDYGALLLLLLALAGGVFLIWATLAFLAIKFYRQRHEKPLSTAKKIYCWFVVVLTVVLIFWAGSLFGR